MPPRWSGKPTCARPAPRWRPGRYDEARPPLEAWLKAHKDDAEARDLLAESYYRPALAAIQAQQWEQAGEALRALWQVQSIAILLLLCQG
jgi:hypothetical protein